MKATPALARPLGKVCIQTGLKRMAVRSFHFVAFVQKCRVHEAFTVHGLSGGKVQKLWLIPYEICLTFFCFLMPSIRFAYSNLTCIRIYVWKHYRCRGLNIDSRANRFRTHFLCTALTRLQWPVVHDVLPLFFFFLAVLQRGRSG